MSGKLLTLFLQYENELRATVPDFAHQMSEMLDVPAPKTNYSSKPVVDYEITDSSSEAELDVHEDFENNVAMVANLDEDKLQSLYEQHFEKDADRETMIAQLADKLSVDDLEQALEHLDTGTEMPCGTKKKKKEEPMQVAESEKLWSIDTYIEPNCGTKKKKKEKQTFLRLEYCDFCEFEHADHFRLCANCNEEHDGCCEILV